MKTDILQFGSRMHQRVWIENAALRWFGLLDLLLKSLVSAWHLFLVIFVIMALKLTLRMTGHSSIILSKFSTLSHIISVSTNDNKNCTLDIEGSQCLPLVRKQLINFGFPQSVGSDPRLWEVVAQVENNQLC